MIGRTLGHFRIVSVIGRGGMGEVFEAEDSRLGRTVAIKVLPALVASDPDRRARFEREARAVAALNHPNIVTIHSVEDVEGIVFLTMERVAGDPLSKRIGPDGVPVRTLLDLGIQIADAVSSAHAHGITHRDLKPDNIMVTADGRVKILDFGLAKLHEMAAEPFMSRMATMPQPTTEGAILGTVAYMSPEQAEGKSVDARTDVFSLGVILYEMATGRRPFQGESHASTMAAILRDTPKPVTEVNRSVPRELARVIRLCLAKDPSRRCQSALDLRNQLEEIRREMDSGELGPLPAVAPSLAPVVGGRRWSAPVLLVVGIVAAATIVWLGLANWTKNRNRPSGVRLSQLTDQQGVEQGVSLAPDGKTFAYTALVGGANDIFVQRVAGGTPVNITNSPESEGAPAFSSDGERIAFHLTGSDAGLFVMGATGESRRRLTTGGYHPAWSPDGKEIAYCDEAIIFPESRNVNSGLWIVDVASGKTRRLTEGDAVQPSWSPDGRRLAYWTVPSNTGQRDILTIAASGGDSVHVTKDGALDWNPVWSTDGKFLYFVSDRGGAMNVWKVPMTPSGRPSGAPQPVTTETSTRPSFLSVAAKTGALAYSALSMRSNIALIPFDPHRHRVTGGLSWVTRGTGRMFWPDVSPDGGMIAFSNFGQKEDIWVCRADGSGLRRLTDDAHRDRKPRWSPDGKRLAFYSNRDASYNIWLVNPDGSQLSQLTTGSRHDILWPTWDPTGNRMAAALFRDRQVFLIDLTKPWAQQQPKPLEGINTAEDWLLVAAWSPDGRYLAGMLSGAGQGTAGVAIYDLETGQRRTVADDARGVAWLPDSKHLLVAGTHGMRVVQPWTGKVESMSYPEPILIIPHNFTLSPDGRTIYAAVGDSEGDIWMLSPE